MVPLLHVAKKATAQHTSASINLSHIANLFASIEMHLGGCGCDTHILFGVLHIATLGNASMAIRKLQRRRHFGYVCRSHEHSQRGLTQTPHGPVLAHQPRERGLSNQHKVASLDDTHKPSDMMREAKKRNTGHMRALVCAGLWMG